MTNAATGKKLLAIGAMACLCAALLAIPAYAMYYVHDEAVSQESDALGAIEVFAVVDDTAAGGTVRSSLMFVPAGSTAQAVLAEGIVSSEDQNGLDAIHNYDVQSIGDYLSANGYSYTVEVYETAEAQAHSFDEGAYEADSSNVSGAYTQSPKGGEDTVLDRYDNVVVTVTK